MEKETKTIIIALIAGLVLFAAVILFYQTGQEIPTPPSPPERHYCDPDSRVATTCLAIYQPVCGFFNTSKVQCIKYPCAQTYGNWCNACVNQDVEYWTDGVCPE